MRNFTFLFVFMLFGAMSFAQQPVVTPVWDHSVAGTADWSSGIPIGGEIPSWMGSLTERGMAYHDGQLFVVSRNENPPVLVVLDAATGDFVENIEIDTNIVRGGTFPVNDIAITPSGKILIANLATNTHSHPFKVYMMEEEEGVYTTSTLVEWMSEPDTIDGVGAPFYRLGDGFAFYGDVSAEENGYVIVGDANGAAVEPTVFKWDIEAGVADTVPEMIVLQEVYPAPVEGAIAKLGITPRLQPLDSMHFWADGHSTFPALYNMQGELLSTFTGEFAPQQAGISGVNFFTFMDQDFILAPTTNHVPASGVPAAMFQLFQIPEAGAEEADSIAVFPERGLGANSNASYAAPMAVSIQGDTAMMFIMSPNNGIAAFALTMEEDTAVVVEGEWNISNSPYNSLGTVDTTTIVNGLTIWAHSEKAVVIDENGKELNGMVFTHRLKLGGSGDFDDDGMPLGRVLSFEVPGNSKITVMGMSSSSSEDRELQIAAGHPDSIFAVFPALGAEISEGIYEYEGDSTTIYLYSSDSGVNIYFLKVEPLTTSVKPIDIMQEVRVYPNPATDKVFVNVKKATQVAIYNLSGSMVKSRLIESSSDFIDVSDLQSGMYIIKSQMSNDFTQKLIVK